MKVIKFIICILFAAGSILPAKEQLFQNNPAALFAMPEKESLMTPTLPADTADVKKRNVAIVLYEGVQLLDFAGHGEVLTDAETDQGEAAFNVYTVAVSTEPIISQGFVTVKPKYSFENAPPPDIIIFPGGDPNNFIKDEIGMKWAKKLATAAEIAMSVCNGARILGQTGLLDNRKVTTHWGSIERLRKEVPTATVLESTRFIDTGRIITTGGVSAGIDGALHLVQRLVGTESAVKTAKVMEYGWQPPKQPSN